MDAPLYEPYLIWSHEHIAWWRPGGMGYTKHLHEAGRFPQADALKTCLEASVQAASALPELPVRWADMQVLLAAFKARYPQVAEEWM